MTKKELRLAYKQKRNMLSESAIADASLQLANQVLKLPIWKASLFHVFLTIGHLKEIDTQPLISILFGKDKQVIIPKSDISSLEMTHYLLLDNTVIKPNIWNIPEPLDGIQIEAQKIEVVFIPLLAYDKEGQRVGYGKGFYDGFLKQCPNAIKIGLSFFDPEERIDDIQPNDVALDYCVTPNHIFEF